MKSLLSLFVALLSMGCAPLVAAPATVSPSEFGPTAPTQTATVVRVVDGDTIIVDLDGHEQRVRYIGIDAPESVRPSFPIEHMGREASAANEAIVGGRSVVLERDVSETDRFRPAAALRLAGARERLAAGQP